MTKINTATKNAPAPMARKATTLAPVTTEHTSEGDTASLGDDGLGGVTGEADTGGNPDNTDGEQTPVPTVTKARKGPIPDSKLVNIKADSLGESTDIGGFKIFSNVEQIDTPVSQRSAYPLEAMKLNDAFYVPYATGYKSLNTSITSHNQKYKDKPFAEKKRWVGRSALVEGVKVYWCKRVEPVEMEADKAPEPETTNDTEQAA